jgi:hypothetical protein
MALDSILLNSWLRGTVNKSIRDAVRDPENTSVEEGIVIDEEQDVTLKDVATVVALLWSDGVSADDVVKFDNKVREEEEGDTVAENEPCVPITLYAPKQRSPSAFM